MQEIIDWISEACSLQEGHTRAIGEALAVALASMESWGRFTDKDFFDFMHLEIIRQEQFLLDESETVNA